MSRRKNFRHYRRANFKIMSGMRRTAEDEVSEACQNYSAKSQDANMQLSDRRISKLKPISWPLLSEAVLKLATQI
jgi:hypothetical protein